MERRFFPSIGKEISLLGFGLMRLPTLNGDPRSIDHETAEKMVDLALASGINYFDTAYIYHDGHSEPFAGKALSRHPRDSYNLATKMPTWLLGGLDRAKEILDQQLSFLRTDHIDFYLVHNLTQDNFRILERIGLYDFLRKRKEEGVIARLGFSMHDGPEHLEMLLGRFQWDFAQIQLNYIDWESLKSGQLYQRLSDNGVPVVIMEPVRGGALAQLPAEAAGILRAHDPAASQASWALRYAASLPGVMTVLSGMTLPPQLEDNLATFNDFKPLDQEEIEVLGKAAVSFRLANPIPCTGCGYCMDCPSGVNIPVNLAIYNHYSTLSLENQEVARLVFDNEYRALKESETAANCVSCEECVGHCPQSIVIPGELEKVAALASQPAGA
ncbi:MAG: aldo/keto reductase [Deltaproteobacteria bacterium]|jgi:predicted aldo/keto reductase-like oxidoreductase|nr:aldo/keto reductase [Deltaproteobacteria bacterium]